MINYDYIEEVDQNLKIIGKLGEYYFLQPVGESEDVIVRKYDDFDQLRMEMD